jgi:putative polyhydroxyalkanoate system protein
MAKTIRLSFPHSLGLDGVRRQIDSAIADARDKYPDALKELHTTWSGDRLDFRAAAMGQTITGSINALPDALDITVSLPFVLGLLAGKFRPRVEQEVKKRLE